jgi:hypothetical protein
MTSQAALDKLAERYVALEAIAEAAREYRAANERYIAVSSRYNDVDSPEWHQASRAQLDREFDLYIALDALAKIESCPS